LNAGGQSLAALSALDRERIVRKRCSDLGPGRVALGAIGFGAFGLVSGGTIGAVMAQACRVGARSPVEHALSDAPIGSFAVSPT
jgi:hypothetical protein